MIILEQLLLSVWGLVTQYFNQLQSDKWKYHVEQTRSTFTDREQECQNPSVYFYKWVQNTHLVETTVIVWRI